MMVRNHFGGAESVDPVDAPETGPRQVGDLPGQDVGVEVEVFGHPEPARPLGHAHQAEGQRAPVVGIDVGLDELGDRGGEVVLDPAHGIGELGVAKW
jgi:hypothetical protein